MIAAGGDRSQLKGNGSSLDRTIVLVGTLAALLFLIVLVLMLIVTGDRRILADTITPALVVVSGAVMLGRGRPDAALHLLIGMVGIAIWAVVGGSGIANDPILGFMTMAIAGTLLVRDHQRTYVIVASVSVATTAFFTAYEGQTLAERTVRTVVSLTSFMVLAWLVTWLKAQAGDRQRRLEDALASKDEFVATVSHELRTPLTTIMGIAHEMQDGVGTFRPAELEEFASLLAAESADIAAIVEDLLVASRSEVGSLTLDLRPISLASELEAATTSFDLIPIQTSRDFPLALVTADAGRTRQIIRNLLSNAQRYGGSDVRIVAATNDVHAVIEVRDNGGPIPEAEREQIFVAYQRAETSRRNPSSVGLGLTVSRQLAQLMNGDLRYEHDGTDSIFRLSLPLYLSEDPEIPEQAVA